MQFKVEYDGYDGLVLMDECYLNEINSELIYSMDILLDYHGKTELVYDFPEQDWQIVRKEKIKLLEEFCNLGKMVVYLENDCDKEYAFKVVDHINDGLKWLNVPTGKLIVLTAGELIQCLSYPELEMEKVFEIELKKGWYSIAVNENGDMLFSLKTPLELNFDNLEMCYKRKYSK